MKEETFPNCTGECEFKITCGRFDDKKVIFYCLKNKTIYQKRSKKEREEKINNEIIRNNIPE